MPMQCPYFKGYSCSLMHNYPMTTNFNKPQNCSKPMYYYPQYYNYSPMYPSPCCKKHKHHRDDSDRDVDYDDYMPYKFNPPMFGNQMMYPMYPMYPMYSTHDTGFWSTDDNWGYDDYGHDDHHNHHHTHHT